MSPDGFRPAVSTPDKESSEAAVDTSKFESNEDNHRYVLERVEGLQRNELPDEQISHLLSLLPDQELREGEREIRLEQAHYTGLRYEHPMVMLERPAMMRGVFLSAGASGTFKKEHFMGNLEDGSRVYKKLNPGMLIATRAAFIMGVLQKSNSYPTDESGSVDFRQFSVGHRANYAALCMAMADIIPREVAEGKTSPGMQMTIVRETPGLFDTNSWGNHVEMIRTNLHPFDPASEESKQKLKAIMAELSKQDRRFEGDNGELIVESILYSMPIIDELISLDMRVKAAKAKEA